MLQVVIRSPTRFEVVEAPRPALRNPGEVLLQTSVAGLCSGDLMEWYLARKLGTVLGHEVVGRAVEVGDAVTHIRPGQLVFTHHHAPCMECDFCRAGDHVQCATWRATKLDPGGMAEYVRIPATNARVDTFAIDDIDAASGVFIEPLGCSVKAVERAQARRQDQRGAVVGCGVMGLLNLAAARALGTRELWAIEPDPVRRELAAQYGATQLWEPAALLKEAAKSNFVGADFVIVGPGDGRVIEEALKYVRPGGRLILFAPTPDGSRTALDLGDIYFRDIAILPSYSCGPVETRLAYDLIRTGRVKVDGLISRRFGIREAQEAYDAARRGGEVVKVVVEF